MGHPVLGERPSGREPLRAEVAVEGLLACVLADVDGQQGLAVEGLVAVLALVVLATVDFPCVGTKVLTEVVLKKRKNARLLAQNII